MADSLSKKQRQELKEAFDVFDADGSGKISQKELGQVFKALNVHVKDDELKKVVQMMDTDGSGQVEFEEFCRVMGEKFFRKYSQEELRAAFEKFDQDHSGYIQAKELQTIMSKMGRQVSTAEVEGMVKALDTSGDGKISFEEFAQLF